MPSCISRTDWKYALIPALVMAFLLLYPQINLWMAAGSGWNGAYAASNYDETAYSAYVNSLIEGRPRRNDPFLAVDDTGTESIYSIQFIPAYVIAVPARILGISASNAFLLLSVLVGILAAAAVFFLLRLVCGDALFAAAGTVVILCLGALLAGEGEIRRMLGFGVTVDFFPFARRYQPALGFPVFFVFCGLVISALRAAAFKKRLLISVFAGGAFAVLVFTYLYLWTTALCWAGLFLAAAALFSKEKRRRALETGAVVAVFAAFALVPYGVLIVSRSDHADTVNLMTSTHAPILSSVPLVLGVLSTIAAFVIRARAAAAGDEKWLFVISLGLTPVLLLEQQVITGKTLQPIHFDVFIANYLVGIAIWLLIDIVRKGDTASAGFKKATTYCAIAAALWGMAESVSATRINAIPTEIRDLSVPAIREAAKGGERVNVILATNSITADAIPTFSTARPLWAPHLPSAGHVEPAENKRLYYTYLYYSGFSADELKKELRANTFDVVAPVFGPDRALPALSGGHPLTAAEIRAATVEFAAFCAAFGEKQASEPIVDSVILPAQDEPVLSNLQRWYEYDGGTTTGEFRVYRLKPKFQPQAAK
ncbi:MAG: hypothetical protein LC113_04225 [Acidobacteria bacterium]|nr:hypothetical protein [Acidobacteriota bacterium]